jgi:hypothetical protein
MAAFLLPLLAGALEGFTEKTKQEDIANAADIQEKLKSAYTARQEKKKELDTQRTEATKVVNSLRGIEFADGTLDNSQLINIASKPKLAESILKKMDDDPEWFKKTSKGFIKQVEGVDPTTDINKHFDNIYRLQKEVGDNAEKFFAAPEDASFLEKRTARKNLIVAKQTAAKLGVSLEDLVASYKPASAFVANMGRVDPSALTKPEDFDKLEKRLKAEHVQAQMSNDPVAIEKADANLGKLIITQEKMRLEKKQEPEIQSDLVNDIQKNKALGTPEGNKKAKELENILQQRKVYLKALPADERTSAANWITIANRAKAARLEELIPGKFISTVGLDGTITMTPKGIGDEQFRAAIAKANREVVNDFTVNGAPKSEFHKNALISIGVGFKEGKPVVGGNVLTQQDIEANKPQAAPVATETPPATAASAAPVPTPSGRSTPVAASPLPYTAEGKPDTSKLIAGNTYRSRDGTTKKWNGTNWE